MQKTGSGLIRTRHCTARLCRRLDALTYRPAANDKAKGSRLLAPDRRKQGPDGTGHPVTS